MPKTKKDKLERKEKYLKINPNAAGLTIGTVSFMLSIILVIGFVAIGENETSIPSNIPGGIILFIVSSFIEGTILGYVTALVYNKFIHIAK